MSLPKLLGQNPTIPESQNQERECVVLTACVWVLIFTIGLCIKSLNILTGVSTDLISK